MELEAQNIHPGFNLIESTSTIPAHQIEKHGKFIRYHITDAGKKYIQNLPGKGEISEEYVQRAE